MIVVPAAAAMAVLDTTMYLVGGCDAVVCGHTDTFAYRQGAAGWIRLADYPEPVSWASCGGIDGKLYCAGGARDGGTTRAAYVYDPGSDEWAPVADISLDMWDSGYAANGVLLVSGGAVAGGSAISNQGFQYDPTLDEWTPIPNSNNALYRGGSACGFYKVGGSSGGLNPTALVEQLPGFDECSGAADVSWLSVEPTAFTVQPGQTVRVTVPLDGTVAEVDQPGSYTAQVGVATDSPYAMTPVGVTMTITPPKS